MGGDDQFIYYSTLKKDVLLPKGASGKGNKLHNMKIIPFLNRWTKKKHQQQQQQQQAKILEKHQVQIIMNAVPIMDDTCLSYETELHAVSITRTSTDSTDDLSSSFDNPDDTPTKPTIINSASLDSSVQNCDSSHLSCDYALQSKDSLQISNQTVISSTSHDSSVRSGAASQLSCDYALQSQDSLQTFDTSKTSLNSASNQSGTSSNTIDSLFFQVSISENGCQVQWCH